MAAPTFTIPDRPLTWLITGSSSGLGLALTRFAQAEGHRVIATSRSPSRTPELVSEIESRGGKWIKLDVDAPDCGDVITQLENEGEKLDVLVNNAGWSVHGPVESFSEDEVRAEMETLYFGPYRLMRAAVPFMRKRRSGIVVNISSGAGLEGRDSMGPYAAGKAALDGISKVLAKEIAPFNVRVLTVQLGSFDTPMANQSSAARKIKGPIDPDYDGSMAATIVEMMVSAKWRADGDPAKAVRAVYEVVVGKGVGAGREAERVLPLGRDMAARVKEVVAKWDHTMEVFGEVCNNVSRDEQ